MTTPSLVFFSQQRKPLKVTEFRAKLKPFVLEVQETFNVKVLGRADKKYV